MTTLTEKFNSFEEQVAAQNEALIDALGTMGLTLGNMLDTLTALNNNQATNARYILNALAQIDPCTDCEGQSPIVPPVTGSAPPIDEDKCKRVHAMLATIGAFADGYTTLQSYNVVATVNVVNSALQSVISGISGTDTVPLPSFPEAVNMVGNYLSSAAAHIFDSGTPAISWALMLPGMKEALYAASTPGDMQSAFNTIVDASSAIAADKLLMKSTAYNALWTYMFDPSSDPDLSAYSGTDCVTFECQDIDSVPSLVNGGGPIEIIVWPFEYSPSDTNGGATSNHLIWATVDLLGFTFTPSEDVTFFRTPADSGVGLIHDTEYTVADSTTFAAIVRRDGSSAFSIHICPPE